MIVRKISFVLFFLSLNVFANAHDDCDTSIPLGHLAACYENNFKLEDAELNKKYTKLKSTLSSSSYANSSKEKYWIQIVQSQKFWIKLRDAQCEAKIAFFEANSIAQLIEKNKCLLNVTKARVDFLNDENQFLNDLP